MPYIRKEFRETAKTAPTGPGELNYCLTLIILDYVRRMHKSYATINEVVGALEQVKDEFQRRVVHPYEDKKREENGEVYQ